MSKIVIIFVMFLISLSLVATEIVELEGDFIESGLILGTLKQEVESVRFNGRELKVDRDKFAFGFGLSKSRNGTLVIKLDDQNRLQINLPVVAYDSGQIDSITVTPEMINPPRTEEVKKRLEREYHAKVSTRKALAETATQYFNEFQRPVYTGRISTKFGAKRVYNGTKESIHSGTDIAKGQGANVRAMANGVVKMVDDFYFSGNFIFIDHGLGLSSEYFHLSKTKVKEGQKIERNQVIGEVGSTGRSTGPHLHWQTYWFTNKLNPMFLIDDETEKRMYGWVE